MERDSDRKKHASACREARQGMRMAKDSRFQQDTMEVDNGRHYGKVAWYCIGDIQQEQRGMVPVRTAVVVDEDGNKCTTPEARCLFLSACNVGVTTPSIACMQHPS